MFSHLPWKERYGARFMMYSPMTLEQNSTRLIGS